MRTSTTWTMRRVLDRVQAGGERVVLYTGGHTFEGTVQVVGEYLVTLEQDSDVIVVELAGIAGIRVCDQGVAVSEPYAELLDGTVLGPEAAGAGN